MARIKQETDTSTTTTVKSGDWSGGKGILPGREVIGPIFLMMTTPIFSIIFFHVCSNLNGNFLTFAQQCISNGFISTIYNAWPTPWDPIVWKMILGFMVFELCLMKIMPGKEFKATVTAGGNVPVYKANGMQSFVVTIVTLLGLTYFVSVMIMMIIIMMMIVNLFMIIIGWLDFSLVFFSFDYSYIILL